MRFRNQPLLGALGLCALGATALLVGGASSSGCATFGSGQSDLPPLETVEQVDLDRYLGTWYEIARIPQRFQRDCTATTATYSLEEDGDIRVLNRCRKGSPDGPLDEAEGRARVVDEVTNAKLEVSFFGPFWGDYWIVELGPNYEYAVVGHPSRDYLWILSRTPTMDPELYQGILSRLEGQGYDTERLVRTVQPPTEQVASAPSA